MKGTVILSHGLESGPQATKVSALARVAEELGWASVRPDYRDLDATRDPEAITARTARCIEAAPKEGRVIFAGSSMGAFISGFASTQRECEALFLMALPVGIEGYAFDYKAAAGADRARARLARRVVPGQCGHRIRPRARRHPASGR